jgi:hypothetical protein
MKRSEQFKLFHRYYDAEMERYENLNKRGSVYLSIISALSLFAGLKFDSINAFISNNHLTFILAAISGIFVLACIAFTLLSLRMYPYKGVVDIEKIIVEIDKKKYSEEDVYTLLLGNLANATKDNYSINNKRAGYLQWAAMSLGSAILMFMIISVTVIFIK